jgi:hypothetical protein
MIQRIQSVWLLVASALGILSLKTSFYSGHRIKDAIPKPMVFLAGNYNILLSISTVAVAVASIINIFLYKNRPLQLKLGIASLLLSILTLLLYYWQTQSFEPTESSYNLTAIIPVAIPVFLFLAIRGIWKDQRLVKSTDRLR